MNKDILAKLLATENITVVHENAPTASFNVKERVLTLPLWDNLNGDNYDHFIGHEVGHALFTPEEGWHGAVCNNGRAYKTFLNVVEDARIERMIQSKYPGLRRNFIKSYRKLLADGFFGADLDEINTYSLIDRINCYFKLGMTAGVRIEKDELCWIKEIEECVTWEQVVDITNRLFAFEKQKYEEMKQVMEDMGMTMQDELADESEYEDGDYETTYDFGDDVEDTDETEEEEYGQGADSEDGEETDETEEGDSNPTDGEGDEETEDDDEGEGKVKGIPEAYGDEPYSKTEEALHENIDKEYNNVGDNEIHNLKMNTQDVASLIIGYKATLNVFDGYVFLERKGVEELKKFQQNNRSVVNYMVKEFEMKKKASEYARTSLAKTGVIDPVKMNGYKFSEDIFRKVAVTPQGKNHGMVMYVDWSGSMANHIKPTIDQVLNLVMFCRQVNIPYRVYMFTDRLGEINPNFNDASLKNTLVYKDEFRLVELFNNRMNRAQFNRMAGNMLMVGKRFNEDNAHYDIPFQFLLGGTPLDDTIMAAIQIHDEFKKSNRLDIVNTVFLTDGDSHTIEVVKESRYGNGYRMIPAHFLYGKQSVIKILDPVTKKQYRVDTSKFGNMTTQLLKIFRDRTGSNAIGYRIATMNRRNVQSDFRRYTNEEGLVKIYDDLKKNRFSTIPNSGYDKFFVLAGGKYLETANSSIEVADDASKGQIRSAFRKANGNRKNTRIMLSQFIDMVA